jgi:hypothetical protein
MPLEQDGELVAAGAGHGVAGAHAVGGRPSATLLEEQVAGVVAEGVVDFLEAVEVDDQHGGLGGVAAGQVDGGGKAVLKEAAVGQRGEGVMQGEVLVVLDLVFEKEQDHAHRDHVLGQVPDLVFEFVPGGRNACAAGPMTKTSAQARKPAMVMKAPAVARRYMCQKWTQQPK